MTTPRLSAVTLAELHSRGSDGFAHAVDVMRLVEEVWWYRDRVRTLEETVDRPTTSQPADDDTGEFVAVASIVSTITDRNDPTTITDWQGRRLVPTTDPADGANVVVTDRGVMRYDPPVVTWDREDTTPPVLVPNPAMPQFFRGDRVVCRPGVGSWCHGKLGTVTTLWVHSTDDIMGHAVAVDGASGWTVLPPDQLEPATPVVGDRDLGLINYGIPPAPTTPQFRVGDRVRVVAKSSPYYGAFGVVTRLHVRDLVGMELHEVKVGPDEWIINFTTDEIVHDPDRPHTRPSVFSNEPDPDAPTVVRS